MLIDTHAHLDFPDFQPDQTEVIARARAQGVTEIISIGTRLDSSRNAVKLAERIPGVWATVGIHPTDVLAAPGDYLTQLRALAAHPRVVALGEIGLDYHHGPSEQEPPSERSAELDRLYRTTQARLFREQLDLASALNLNVVIHQRDAWDDTLQILADYRGKVRGVFHCFGGTLAQAETLFSQGHLVSFTGIITFKNAQVAQDTARTVPLDRFMVETDCPYLAPAPHRGKRCEPGHTRLVAERIAQLRGVSWEEVARATTATAQNFFKFHRSP